MDRYPFILRAVLGLTLFFDLPAFGQPYPQWGDLEAGPYAVGFRYETRTDASRTYGGNARPLPLYVWYPAEAGNPPALYGAYLDLWEDEVPRGADLRAALRRHQFREGLSRTYMRAQHLPDGPDAVPIPDSTYARVLATPTASVWNAAPLPGSFPVIITAFGCGGAGLMINNVQCEYLASHGYVVVSMPSLGTQPMRSFVPGFSAEEMLSDAQDVARMAAFAAAFPSADPARIGALSLHTAGALVYQFQSQRLQAIAFLDEAPVYEEVQRLTSFDPARFRIPLLNLPFAPEPPNRPLLDSLRYSERYTVQFAEADHSFFSQMPQVLYPGRKTGQGVYTTVMQTLRTFFDATLKADPEARQTLSVSTAPSFHLHHLPAEPAPANQEMFISALMAGDTDETRRLYQQAKASGQISTLVGGGDVYYLMRQLAAVPEAGPLLLIFYEAAAEAFPKSLFILGAYGDALAAAGHADRARQRFEAALTLISQASDLKAEDRAQQEQLFRARIAALEQSNG